MSKIKQQLPKIPKNPGVYLFKDEKGNVLYVGKSISVQERIKSHLSATGEKTKSMVSLADHIEVISVNSELEALLLEARLIKEYLPKYNSAAKDGKSPLYIKITKEEFPRVLTARKSDIDNSHFFGPFPSSRIVKTVLRELRRIFPYHSSSLSKRVCLYSHLGLCHPCPNYIMPLEDLSLKKELTKQYRHNIARLISLLSGKSKGLKKDIEKEMSLAVKNEDFEQAAYLRDQISNLEYITSDYRKPNEYLKNPNLLEDIRDEEVKSLYDILSKRMKNLKSPRRIECFDNSHTGGKDATSSMVTFVNGEPDKNFYRQFKIRKAKGTDDFAMMGEVITRRLKHLSDWGEPNLIIIDGGKGQVTSALEAMKLSGVSLPVIGLAKRLEEIIIPKQNDNFIVLRLRSDNLGLHLLQRLRDESHRFARRYHFKLRLKNMAK